MLQIKIQGATPKSGKSICLTCKKGTVVKGQNCQEVVFCNVFQNSGGVVPFRVAECGEYHPVNVPWLHEMEALAWKIEARRRGPAGFTTPDEDVMEVVVVRPRNSGLPENCAPSSD